MPMSMVTISDCIRHAQAWPLHATMLFPAHSREWKIWPADSARVKQPAQHSTDRSHISFMSPHSTSRPMIENTDLQLVVTCHAWPKHQLMSPEDRKLEWLIGRPSVPLTASADRMVWYSHPQVISSCRFCSWLKRFGSCPALHGHAVCDSWQRTGLNECLMHIH